MEYTRTLKKRSAGEDVLKVKKQLFSLGYYAPAITKIESPVFGSDTVNAVKRFQADIGLKADGIVGKRTWMGLFEQDTGACAPVEEAPAIPVQPSDKALEIVRLARERIGDLYVWGGSGMTDLSDAKIRERDDNEGASRSMAFRDKQIKRGFSGLMGHDCSGFISYLLRACDVWDERRDCDALWSRCTQISRAELIPGDLVFRVSSLNGSDETHVGLYCGRGCVIHDKGRDVGVVMEGIDHKAGYWHKCGRLKILYM